MIRITETTDGKYRGKVIDENEMIFIFNDGFTMLVESVIHAGGEIIISNPNYIIRGVKTWQC